MTTSDTNGPEAMLNSAPTDVLAKLLQRMAERDPADAPELAAAIGAVLASRLEGTSIPDDAQAVIDAIGSPS